MDNHDSLLLLGNLAVEKGMLSVTQLQIALKQQADSVDQLGHILVKNQFLSKAELRSLLDLHELKVFYEDEVQFGKLAVRNGLISQLQLDETLKSAEGFKERPLIGDLLVSRRLLRREDRDAVLKAQNRLTHKQKEQDKVKIICPTCEKGYKIKDPDRFRKVRCKECKFVFEVGAKEVGAEDLDPVITALRKEEKPNEPAKKKTSSSRSISRSGHIENSLEGFINEHDVEVRSDLAGQYTHDFSSEHNNKYSIGEEIARGGMGVIHETYDVDLRRNIVTKVLIRNDSKGGMVRFIEEAQITGQLEHPNIVPVYDMGVNDEGQVYFTMKKVNGRTLKEIIEDLKDGDEKTIEEYSLNNLIEIMLKICDGVSFSHHKGVLHRDLKPENIMVGEFGEVLVMDWGLAKVLGQISIKDDVEDLEEMEDLVTSDRNMADMIQSIQGTIAGTPQYMAPEQAKGQVDMQDRRTDVYALGGLLHYCLAYRTPVDGKNVQKILSNVVKGKRTPIPGHVHDDLQAIVDKAMDIDPDYRYPSVMDFKIDLLNYQRGFSVSAKDDNIIELLLKYFRRNMALSSMFGLAILFLSIGLGIATDQINTANKARKATEATFNELKVAKAKSAEEEERLRGLQKRISTLLFDKAKASFEKSDYGEAFKEISDAYGYDRRNMDACRIKAFLSIMNGHYKKGAELIDIYRDSLRSRRSSKTKIMRNHYKTLSRLAIVADTEGLTPDVRSRFSVIFIKLGLPKIADFMQAK